MQDQNIPGQLNLQFPSDIIQVKVRKRQSELTDLSRDWVFASSFFFFSLFSILLTDEKKIVI